MSDDAEQTLPGAAHAESDAGQAVTAAADTVQKHRNQDQAQVGQAAGTESEPRAEAGAVPAQPAPAAAPPAEAAEVAETEAVSAETVPAEAVPAEGVAAEAVPAETVPAEAVSAEPVSVEAAPAEAVPAEPVSIEAVSVEAVPAETVAAEVPAPAPVPAAPEPAAEVPVVSEVSVSAVSVSVGGETVAEAVVVVEASCEWGRVAVDGSVFVRTAEGEKQIGSWAAGTPADGLAFFERKFDGLKAEVELLEKRLNGSNLDVKDADSAIAKLREALVEPHAIGDLAALRTRLDRLGEVAEKRRAARREARARQLTEAAAHKERIVSEAESLVESTEWKATGERLRALVDEWKGVPRLDRRADDELWSRFSSARSAFAKRRKAHFAHLDAEREEVRQRKEALVEQAEELSDSTDWAATAQRFRDLMRQWKAAGRAQRDVEDKLWERFKSAQDTFFTARNADLDQRDAGFRENLARKEELLLEAQRLVSDGAVKDYKAARTTLRSIQQRWEEIGPVPRDAKPRVEGALRDVERAVADSEQAEWKRTNPEARARAEATVRQLETSIGKFEKELEKARANGQQRKADEAEAALTARREWLAQAQAALEEFTR